MITHKMMKLGILVTGLLAVAPDTVFSGVRFGFSVGYTNHRHAVVAPVRFHPGPACGFHNRTVVVPANYGRVDFNVRPKDSRVFVDGAFIGIADQYDGGFFGTTATLRPGTHWVKLVAPDGRSIRKKIYVMPGKELNFNFEF